MDFITKNAKTFAAFAATLALNMITSLINGDTVWPQNSAEWVQYLVTSFGAAFAVYTARNKITEKQVEKGITKGDVTPEAVKSVAVNTPAPPVTPTVDSGNLVDQVVRDAQIRGDS